MKSLQETLNELREKNKTESLDEAAKKPVEKSAALKTGMASLNKHLNKVYDPYNPDKDKLKKQHFGVSEEVEQIQEKIYHDDYHATSETSQFGGHRPHVVSKDTGKTMYLGQHAYKTPKHAIEHANAYLHAYAKTGMHGADRASQAYASANKHNQHINEEVLDEANHREFACSGCMHPDMAKNMKTGQETDFYHSKTGDKISGVVKKNTDGEVHIKAHKDGKMGAGDVHKFKVTSKLDEALKGKQKKLDKNHNGKLDKKDFEILRKEETEQVDEVLKPSMGAGAYIDDFIKSKNPKFAGKSDEKRRQMAIAAFMAAKRSMKEEAELDEAWVLRQKKKDKKQVKEEDMKSFKDFLEEINEVKMADLPSRQIKGKSYGNQPEEDDDDDKPTQSAEKRGRGRPAGAKSGAKQIGSASKQKSGVEYTGYKLHLPNSNK
jgi:hypothetical protein